jgi:drug/metabolite transporter (DMT)-like permease
MDMTRRDLLLLAALSVVWGASFMFIRVADRQIDPWALVFLRVLLGAAVLVPAALLAGRRRALAQAREAWLALLLLGTVNTAVPFLLFSWSETRITSSLAAILQAAAPIFAVLIAVALGLERVGGRRLGGFLVGFAGVALLLGSPGGGGLLPALAVVLAAFGYACGATFASRKLTGVDPLVIGAGSCVAATLITAPLGVAHLPGSVPGWKETGSVVVLGLAGTGIAYVMMFALLASAGASRSILVTYTIPPVALAYGVLLLGEPLRWESLAGLALILGGVAFAAGKRRESVEKRSGSLDPANTAWESP